MSAPALVMVDEINRVMRAWEMQAKPRSKITLTSGELAQLERECRGIAVYPPTAHVGSPVTVYGMTIVVDDSVAGVPLADRDGSPQ